MKCLSTIFAPKVIASWDTNIPKVWSDKPPITLNDSITDYLPQFENIKVLKNRDSSYEELLKQHQEKVWEEHYM